MRPEREEVRETGLTSTSLTFADLFLIENDLSSSFPFLLLPTACRYTYQRNHTNTNGSTDCSEEWEFTSSEQRPQGLRGVSSALLCLSLFPSNSFCFPLSFASQSPRAETLMKTNARNQFAASSLHLAGARLCASISTAAGGELLQNSPITHTSVLRSSYRLQALLTEECIKMKRMCYLKLSSENMFFFWTKEWNNSFAKLHSVPFNVLQQPSWSTTKRISGSNEVFKLHYHLWLVEEANLESSHMPVIDIR